MWPGNDASRNITYDQQRKSVKDYVQDQMGVVTRKVTHAFRTLGARNLDDAGIDDSVKYLPGPPSCRHHAADFNCQPSC